VREVLGLVIFGRISPVQTSKFFGEIVEKLIFYTYHGYFLPNFGHSLGANHRQLHIACG